MNEFKFFFKKRSIKIGEIFPEASLKKNFIIKNVRPLDKAEKNDITFFDSVKYKDKAIHTNASVCITTNKLEKYLPSKVSKIIVNVRARTC